MKSCSLIIAFLVIMNAGPALAERLSVNVSLANIRSGPGTQNKILWKVEKYHPLEIIRKTGSWYYFRDFEGDRGWIFKDLVSKIPSVIVIKNKCNVRSGSGTNFKILFTVEKGVPLKVIKRKGEWLHVQHADGDKGWIHKTLIW